MTGRVVAVLVFAALASCAPAPRSAAYFEAHREEAAKVAADCKTGAHRGEECVNALAGVAAAARDARMAAYKKNF